MEERELKNNGIWLKKGSTHYIFNYKQDSLAEQFLENIMEQQEKCFQVITELLEIIPNKKIIYWLCESREEVAEKSGFYESNGLTHFQDGVATIYCVYNETIKCIGYHEDTHAIAFYFSDIKCDALAEGLAMYMDRTWWSVDNKLCTLVYLEYGKYIPVEKMIFGNFYEIEDKYSYPIMGAFVEMLIEKYGIDRLKKIYAYEDDHWTDEFFHIYGITLMEAENEFINYIKDKGYSEEQINVACQKLAE